MTTTPSGGITKLALSEFVPEVNCTEEVVRSFEALDVTLGKGQKGDGKTYSCMALI